MAPRVLSILVLFLGLVAATARAELIVSVTDATLTPGGSAVVDVLVAGDGVAALDLFSIVVRLEGVPGGRRLVFVAPGPGSQTDGQLSDPSYLFAGDSVFAGGIAGTLADEPNPSDTYIGGDGTLSGSGVLVPMTPTLLTRLQLTGSMADTPIIGDRFRVVVDLLDARSSFLDAALDPIPIRFAGPGIVSVVPEPSGLALLSAGLAAVGLAARREARVRRPAPDRSRLRS
ncbi:PEP-CTERM sorting domain-containing protein [Tautonia plasticadhaerens]|uniref:PEP-CTERM protein-sorting domain-containing protein n=1 Tax=Tautonia plasticadhaerens TaxID=2527974 RepID=A0A518H6H3_9BACT|nr:PEP-CTERM sorting domain-containing protein [Tautonia plasticadhaerens]QDV36431.1 hypothetical protein ElP_43550 [Tautonia plasticadhaerens]